MSVVAIVDYGMGNLDSVARAVEECGGRPLRAAGPRDLAEAAHVILPGVGAFRDAMASLRRTGMADALEERVRRRGIPFLGLCLGMELLATRSFEGGEHAGLGWIDGDVVRFETGHDRLRVPHVGWNNVEPVRESVLFHGIRPGTDFYFVHSYHVACRDRADLLATTPYGLHFASSLQRENVWACQFHPEKSQAAGLRLLANFLAL